MSGPGDLEPRAVGLDDVLITEELGRRPSRPPDHAAENRSLASLARAMVASPETVLQQMADAVLGLCRADSAGISILEPGGAQGIFRWHATAGEFAGYLGGTMPREASPCGTVIHRDAVLLFDRPERHFPVLRGVEPAIHEGLLAPFHARGQPVGTVWVTSHAPGLRFDAEDARLLVSLSRFASVAYQTTAALRAESEARGHLEQRVGERTAEAAAARAFAESIVDTVRDPLLVLDGDLRVVSASREFYRTFGVEPAETEGRLVYDLGNRQWNIPRLRTLLEEILPEGTTFRDFEVEHHFQDIGRKVMLLNACRLHQGPGVREMILLAIEDATARRDAEEARQEAETRFTEMVKNVRDHSIFLTDPDGVITSWNVAAERIIGYRESEAVGRHFSLVFTPEDVRAGLPERELRLAREQGRAEDERWHLRKGGERFWALGIVTPLRDPDGRPSGFSKILRDMTDRKRAEEAVRESERRLKLALGAARMGTWTWDVASGFKVCDANLSGLLGLEPVETRHPIGGFVRHHIHPQDREAVSAALDESVRRGRPLNLEFRVVRPDGAVRWLRDQGGVFGEAGVETPHMAGTCMDVTDLKEAEAALREREERLRLIVEGATDYAIFTLDADRRVTTWSPGAEAVFGYAGAEILGRPGDLLFTPEDRAAGAPEAEAGMARREGRAADERWLVRRDGSRFFASGVLTPLGHGAVGFVKVLRDLTERKRMEDALARDALVLASVHDAVVVTDPDGVVTYWNEGAALLFGWSAGEVVGRPYADRFPEPERSWIAAEIEKRVQGVEWSGEYEDRRKDGSRVWIDARVARYDGSDGQPAGILGVSRDITARKRMEDELRRARDELERRVEARTAELAAALDSLEAEMARRRDLARRLSTAQEDERRRVSRDLHDTIGQLMAGLSLAFKAVETSGSLPPPTAAKLAQAQQVANELGKEVHALAVRLRPTALDDIGLEAALGQLVAEWSGRTEVRADLQSVGLGAGRLPAETETAVYRVVQEALTNVAKHARATRVSVAVSRPGGDVVVAIEDDGTGFDAESVPNGRLGLVGMRERAALAGGELDVETGPGAGTTVVARIPVPEGDVA